MNITQDFSSLMRLPLLQVADETAFFCLKLLIVLVAIFRQFHKIAKNDC